MKKTRILFLILLFNFLIVCPNVVEAKALDLDNTIILNDVSYVFLDGDVRYDVKDTTVGEICSMPQYRKVAKFFGSIVTFVKYIIPIIIIAFGIMDLYNAVTSAKDDQIKKSFKSIGVRVAAGVLVFLLPGLVQFFFNMLNDWSNYKVDVCCCTECILNSSCDVNSCNSKSCKIEGMNS